VKRREKMYMQDKTRINIKLDFIAGESSEKNFRITDGYCLSFTVAINY